MERTARDKLHKETHHGYDAGSNVVRKLRSKAKSSRKTAAAVSANLSSAIDVATRLFEDRVRERAYGIWIAEGRPQGRELAHWQRAHYELQREAR